MRRMAPPARARGPRVALLQEQRYRRRFLGEDSKQTAILLAIMAVVYAIASANDFAVLRDAPLLLGISLAARAQLVVATGIALILLRRARWPRQYDRALYLGLLAVAIATSGVHLLKIPSGRIQGPLMASLVLVGNLYFALRGPILPRAVVASVIAAGGVALVVFGNSAGALDAPARVVAILALVSLNLVGIFAARSFEEHRRRGFEAQRHERHARNELATKLRELAAEKERAEAATRARTAFLAVMSHEFRTPMNAVLGLSDVLLDEPLATEHHAHVQAISDSARALLGLLNDILDFAKIDAEKLTLSPAPFDLRRLVVSVVEMLRPAAREGGLALSLELARDLPEVVVGDGARLRQVLVNLVSNAVKFTERGAVRVEISARAGASGDDPVISFRVEDSGVGMAPDVVARLFRPFEQADGGTARRYGGTGLGLAISKQIVVAMGGHIHVESAVGRGSVFSFELALREAAAARLAPTVPAQREDRPPLAILVVDDNAINRRVARATLERLGHAADVACDGREAIEAVTSKDYDVVFMDLQMPGMSGIEATAQIGRRLEGKRAPHIIAMTASVYEADREACRRAGMRDFLGKPIDLAQLDAALARVSAERGDAPPRALPAAPPAPITILAPASLARLRRIESFGQVDFVATLARRFLADMHRRLPRMSDALGRGDAETIAEEARYVAASSATLGATELSALGARLEVAARRGRFDELGIGLDALSGKFVEVERALEQEIQGLIYRNG
jgi:signal transduction histidine kinase/CheY-like chemotaxis protein/HPt (histidine-containing phosphotransfer) domain-containing protein